MSTGCPSIAKPNGGEIIPNKSHFEYGESVTVLCRQAYDLLVDETLICLRSGLWSKEMPTCSQGKTTTLSGNQFVIL